MEFLPAFLSLWAIPVGALLLGGAIAGLLAGLFGIGGGIVMVPVLYYFFTVAIGVDEAVRIHLSIGTSLSIVALTTLRSSRAHARRNAVDGKILLGWWPFLVAGVAAGTTFASAAPARLLIILFALALFAVAARMWRDGTRESKENDAANGASRSRTAEKNARERATAPADALDFAHNPWGRGAAFLVGAISSSLGIGGGALTVPILTAYRVPIHRAVGTAAALGLCVAVPSAGAYVLFGLIGGRTDALPGWPWSLGFVSPLGFICGAAASTLTAPLGARLAHASNSVLLYRLFAIFLLVSGWRFLAQAL